jgi:hypothetical protein
MTGRPVYRHTRMSTVRGSQCCTVSSFLANVFFIRGGGVKLRTSYVGHWWTCCTTIFKVCVLLRDYNQYIPILPSSQQLFINIYSTTCFDPNVPSSGAARLTHLTTELQRVYSHLHTYGSV